MGQVGRTPQTAAYTATAATRRTRYGAIAAVSARHRRKAMRRGGMAVQVDVHRAHSQGDNGAELA